jgi:hypothetical protein
METDKSIEALRSKLNEKRPLVPLLAFLYAVALVALGSGNPLLVSFGILGIAHFFLVVLLALLGIVNATLWLVDYLTEDEQDGAAVLEARQDTEPTRPWEEYLAERAARETTIIVNAHKRVVTEPILSYHDIVGQARLPPRADYSVVYRRGPDESREGILLAGQSVRVKEGMIFSVVLTNNA